MRAVAALLCLLASEAAALSCMAQEPSHAFNRASDAQESYIVLLGEMAFERSALPQGVVNEERNPDPVPAEFIGLQLTADGFSQAYDGAVTIQPTCAGPWCGGLLPGKRHIFFLEIVDGVPTLDADACSTWHFSDPTDAMIAEVEACMRGDTCPKPLF